MKRTLMFSLLALGTLGTAQAADTLSYTYLEAGKTWVDVDGGTDGDGWSGAGSVALGSQFHLYGGYGSAKLDDSDIDVDISRLGVGWNRSINDASDLVVRANWLKLDAGFPFGENEGYEAEVGLRSGWTPNFETYLAAGYADIDRGDGDFYGKLGAQYRINPTFGIAASATLADDNNEYFVGPRVSF